MKDQRRAASDKYIECVPNFSEGRDKNKINAIIQSIKKVKGIKLLDAESDKDHNRTVITFVGGPIKILDAAFNAIKKAAEVIDMRRHKGAHPRIGAADVCPFVPIKNVAIKECADLAKKLGKKVGQNLKIPVYLYGEASSNPGRKTLSQIRAGEYEKLAEKMNLKEWKPDFGPKKFNPKSGAAIIGARNFLLAFNVNLKSKDIALAKKIAGQIRESGVKKKINGQIVKTGGEFKEVKALGIKRGRGFVQVSMNLTDFKTTGMHAVFERIKKLAKEKGVQIASSELVGLAPLEAILKSGKFYNPAADSEKELIRAAVKNMKLDQFSKFEPKRKIIEYVI